MIPIKPILIVFLGYGLIGIIIILIYDYFQKKKKNDDKKSK